MKLLYIKCNPKPENRSACLRVGRELVNRYARRYPDNFIEELDLYQSDIPEADSVVFNGRSGIVSGSNYDALSDEHKAKADRIHALCTQFLSADDYIIAAPMWSLTFPPRLKAYIDCVVLNGRTIKITPQKVEGLMHEPKRRAVFVQSCGGNYGNIVSSRFNYGALYLKNLFFFLGMDDFVRLPVDGTGMPDIGVEYAVTKATGRIDEMLDVFER